MNAACNDTKLMTNPTRHRRAVSSFVLISSIWGLSCDSAVTSVENLPPLRPAKEDSLAGSWSMLVLSGPLQFPVLVPAPVTAPAYQAELAAIRATQATLTAEQRRTIDYW